MTELSHTLTVRPNLFIRTYLKFYKADRRNINTCKLFWGGVGMVVLPPILLVLSPLFLLVYGILTIGEKVQEHSRAKGWVEQQLAFEPEPEPGPSRREQWLEWVSIHAPMLWAKIGKPVTWVFRILVGAALIALAAYGVYHLGDLLIGIDWADVLPTLGIVVLGALVFAAVAGSLIFGGMYLHEKYRKTHPKVQKPSVFKAVFRSIHDHTCARIVVDESEKVHA